MTADWIDDGIPYDATWEYPSVEQMACLEWVRARKPTRVDENEAVEMIMFATQSRWYRQILSWQAEMPEEFLSFIRDKTEKTILNQAIQGIVEIVDLGYNEEKRRWWDIDKMSASDLQVYLLWIGMVTRDLIRLDIVRGGRPNFSFGVQFFMEMMMGRGWSDQVNEALDNIEKQSKKQAQDKRFRYKHRFK